jgi:hypothetical protein
MAMRTSKTDGVVCPRPCCTFVVMVVGTMRASVVSHRSYAFAVVVVNHHSYRSACAGSSFAA